jgi:radical SAM enzyme (TIGR01210 family)
MRKELTSSYPMQSQQLNSWIVDQRPPRNVVDPYRPYTFLVEDECSADREVVPVATVFLTNRECPWRCVMCDLWKNTLTQSVPAGAIPQQIEHALARLPAARQVKLYNSGSFFDERAIPKEDYKSIAQIASKFERTIVESHPSLVGKSCVGFRDQIGSQLEVAMGLETVHPEVLDRLNKRMTLDQFAQSAEYLRGNGIDLRVFILVQPPFMRPEESLDWAQRSLDFAFDCGATAATLIPTRGGNGAMESLAQIGEFTPPALATVERAASYGLGLGRGRVFVDLWEMHNRSYACQFCLADRADRLHRMNLSQRLLSSIECSHCEALS